MADMMAIISKAVFEKVAGKAPSVGTRLDMDRYVSANKNLERLGEGGKLYLVTVRPPDEALWLVAILDNPKFDGKQWIAKQCTTAITDITALRGELTFESGKGITAAKGALGMSLQTPRVVTAADVELLDRAAAADVGDGPGKLAGKPKAKAKPGGDGFPAAPEGAVGTGAGNRRELLLAAVVADPDNDAARQVYADALMSANDPRGEFILVETALDGPLSIRKRAELAIRKQDLVAKHAKTWWPYPLRNTRTQRGFVVAVGGTLKQINKVAPELFAAEPVTEVEVERVDDADAVAALTKAMWLSRVRRLIIRGDIGDEGFATLVAAPALATLQALNVSSNSLGATALTVLQQRLPSCRALVLTGNGLGDDGMRGLAQWAHLDKVEMLYLSKCGLSAKGVEYLLSGASLTHLAKLTLTGNQLGNGIAALLAKHATKLPSLRTLELCNTGLGAPGVMAFASVKLPMVRRIDVRKNGLDARSHKDDPRITA